MKEFSDDWLYHQIVDGAPEAIIFSDRDGLINLWDAGAEEIFGYKAEEAMEQSLDLIIPKKPRARHWEGYQKVMSTGSTRHGRK